MSPEKDKEILCYVVIVMAVLILVYLAFVPTTIVNDNSQHYDVDETVLAQEALENQEDAMEWKSQYAALYDKCGSVEQTTASASPTTCSVTASELWGSYNPFGFVDLNR